MSCKKAQGYLEEHALVVQDRTDASKDRRGRAAALALAKTVDKIVVARPKSVVIFDMIKTPPDDDTLADHLLGPTGNLKAPTLQRGRTLLVGFSEGAYKEVFGG